MIKRCSTPRRKPALVYPADDESALERAVELLRQGGLVVFPTDTVYGVGADARLPDAVMDIYLAKQRPPDKAIPLLIAELQDALPFIAGVPEEALALIEAFWPGALTLVLPIAKGVPAIISPGPGIAVRMPAHPTPLELIRRLGAPLAATSANLSGHPDPLEVRDVVNQLGRRVDLVLDGGRTPGSSPSTVVDLTKKPPRVLRAGPISIEELRRFLPGLES